MNDLLRTKPGQLSLHSRSGVVGTGVRPVLPSRLVLLLLACASAASAIPLKKGNTWTWLVVDRAGQPDTWRSVSVLDSSKGDSGTLWRIVGRDSLAKSEDTGTLLQRKDGSQAWWSLSKWISWEPQAMSVGATGGSSRPYPWGCAQYLAAVGYPPGSLRISGSTRAPLCSYSTFEGGIDANCPLQTFDSAGLPSRVRSMSAASKSGGVDLGLDWFLVRRLGHEVAPKPDSLALPPPGTVLVWEERKSFFHTAIGMVPMDSSMLGYATRDSSQLPCLRRWQILSSSPDSAGWMRLAVAETFTDSVGKSSAYSFILRFDPATGKRTPARPSCPSPDEGWWSPPGTWASIRFGGSGYTGAGSTLSSDAQTIVVQYRMQEDSAACSSGSTNSSDPHRVYPTIDRSIFTRRLISIDGTERRSTVSLRSPSPRGVAQVSLPTLALLHPGLPIHWRDARGRGGQLPAAELARGRAGTGILFLDAVLPDGTPWRAMSAIPLR